MTQTEELKCLNRIKYEEKTRTLAIKASAKELENSEVPFLTLPSMRFNLFVLTNHRKVLNNIQATLAREL